MAVAGRKRVIFLGVSLVAIIIGSVALAQIRPLSVLPAPTPAAPTRPPLITPVRPPLISPIRP